LRGTHVRGVASVMPRERTCLYSICSPARRTRARTRFVRHPAFTRHGPALASPSRVQGERMPLPRSGAFEAGYGRGVRSRGRSARAREASGTRSRG
jgi:hypothetical protein